MKGIIVVVVVNAARGSSKVRICCFLRFERTGRIPIIGIVIFVFNTISGYCQVWICRFLIVEGRSGLERIGSMFKISKNSPRQPPPILPLTKGAGGFLCGGAALLLRFVGLGGWYLLCNLRLAILVDLPLFEVRSILALTKRRKRLDQQRDAHYR